MKTLGQFKETQCDCAKCVSYCKRTPGWFRLGQIIPLAKFLGMTVQEAFDKYLIADFWIGDSEDIYLLAPAKSFEKVEEALIKETISLQKEQNKLMGRNCDEPGSRASWSYAFFKAPCTFLKDSRCGIYPVRPFECRVAWHGKKQSSGIRELIAEEWEGNKLIDELLEN